MKVVVDRSKWRYGGDKHEDRDGLTLLLNRQGLMCCLGFGCLASGLEPEAILECCTPSSISEYIDGETVYPDELSWLREIENDAIRVNDDKDISDEERESRLKQVFAAHNHEIEFTGEYRTEASLLKPTESQPAIPQIAELRA